MQNGKMYRKLIQSNRDHCHIDMLSLLSDKQGLDWLHIDKCSRTIDYMTFLFL